MKLSGGRSGGAFDGRGTATTARGSDGFAVTIVVDIVVFQASGASFE